MSMDEEVSGFDQLRKLLAAVLAADVVVAISATPLGGNPDGSIGHGVKAEVFNLSGTLDPEEFTGIMRTFVTEMEADLEAVTDPRNDPTH